jgi:hypothetical protein
MTSIRPLLTWAAVILAFSASSAASASEMRKQIATGGPDAPSFPSGGGVLYSQLDAGSGFGAPDPQIPGKSEFDSEGADDFVVTAGPWSIGGLNTAGIKISDNATHVHIAFYEDEGGRPAATAVPGCQYLYNRDFDICRST